MIVSYPRLFEPGRIGELTAKNRLVLPPMVRNYADDQGHATPRYVAHVERIARGGVGTIILEAAYVRQDGRGFSHQLGLHDDSVIKPLRKVVEAGHRHGALMGIQVFHGGRQASSLTSGHQPLAPSAIPDPVVNELPRAMTTEDIAGMVGAFADASRRAVEAGCDFIELHAAHGYLIAQFLSGYSNHRNDEYGATPENRRRFLEEIFVAVRDAIGDDFPIIVRLSAEEAIPDGLALTETVATAKRLETLGAAALHVSNGSYATYAQGRMIPPMAIPDGILLPFARAVREAVSIPVIAVGKIRNAAMAERALSDGDADFIAIGRSLLADPDWPNKYHEGRDAEVRHCIACNQGCISRLFLQKDVWCTINPEVGRELQFAQLHDNGKGRLLVIVGAGPAGMAAARWAVDAGFTVALYDALEQTGGQLIAAATAPNRDDWAMLREFMTADLHRRNVRLHLGHRVTAEEIIALKPAAVILASGAQARKPLFDRTADAIPVVTGRAVLEGSAAHQGHIVVAGGGCSGAQTAEYLASCGHAVTVVEAIGDIAVDAPIDERMLLLGRLAERGVRIMTNTRVMKIGHDHVVVQTPSALQEIAADMVVVCMGSEPETALAKPLAAAGISLHVVGDANEPRKVTEAILEGALAVLDIAQH